MAPETRSISAAQEAANSQPGPAQASVDPTLPRTSGLKHPVKPDNLRLRREQLELQKAEADVIAVEARMKRETEESRARIAAIEAGTVTAAAPGTATDKIAPEALLAASRYPGIPTAEIARIFANKFRPEHLYKLRQGPKYMDWDDDYVIIENGQMKLKRTSGSLRNFGSNWDIWSESFLNYTMILVDFFGPVSPTLFRVLLLFHAQIRKLSKIYEWQNAVLPLALDYHTEITATDHTDTDAWFLPRHWIDAYCSPLNFLNGPSKKRTNTATLEGHIGKKNAGNVCRKFNTKGCGWGKCARAHKCTECDSKDHGAQAYIERS